MVYEFNEDNITAVYFNNDERTFITVEFTDAAGFDSSYTVQAKPRLADFQYLLTLFTLEQIEENTINRMNDLYEVEKNLIKDLIESGVIEATISSDADADTIENLVRKDLFDMILEPSNEDHAGCLFELKLGLFDDSRIADAPTEIKDQIRLAPSAIECLNIAHNYLNPIEN